MLLHGMYFTVDTVTTILFLATAGDKQKIGILTVM